MFIDDNFLSFAISVSQDEKEYIHNLTEQNNFTQTGDTDFDEA